MAQSLTIGGLRVDLSMDAAQFKKDGKQAEGVLADFEKAFSGFAGKLATYAAGAFAGFKFAESIKDAIVSIDDLARQSDKLSIPVERLSAMQYAAEQTGLSVEDLGKAFEALLKPSDEAKQTFTDLSISLKDAQGNVKPLDVLLTDIAGTFEKYRDTAEKATAANNIFGEEIGAKMLPFLAKGKDGLVELQAEARRMGLTISDEAAQGVRRMNDRWAEFGKLGSQLSANWREFISQVLVRLMPLLEGITRGVNSMVESWRNALEELNRAPAGRNRETMLADTMKEIQKTDGEIKSLKASLAHLGDEFDRLDKQANEAGISVEGAMAALARDALPLEIQQKEDELAAALQRRLELLKQIRIEDERSQTMKLTEKDDTKYDEVNADEYAKAVERARQALQAFMHDRPAFENTFEKLTGMLKNGTLSLDQYAAAQRRLNQLQNEMKFNASLSGIGKLSGALGQLFEKNKAFAIGQAAIDAYTSFNAALKNPPGPPWTIPAAAAALVSGIAQVRNIMATRPGSPGGGGGGGGYSSGGGGSAASGAALAPGAGAPAGALVIQGLNPASIYSGATLEGLIAAVNDAVKNGTRLISTEHVAL